MWEGGTISSDVIGYNAAISAYEKGGQWEEALTLFEVVIGFQLDPDIASYNALLHIEISSQSLGGDMFQNS